MSNRPVAVVESLFAVDVALWLKYWSSRTGMHTAARHVSPTPGDFSPVFL